jgi:hypothetical protein
MSSDHSKRPRREVGPFFAPPTAEAEEIMARKPNYGFEKRQKELARKTKKEEKKLRKQESGEDNPGEVAEAEED